MCLIHVNINSDKGWTMIVPWSERKSITLRFLVYQNTALFSTFRPPSSVRPSVCHRRDISTFLDNLMVKTTKIIYFLNA